MSKYQELPSSNGRARARVSVSKDELVIRIKLDPIYRRSNRNGNWPIFWTKNLRMSRIDPELRGLQLDCNLYLNDMDPTLFNEQSGLMRGESED